MTPVALTIAGSDSGGGAGIQIDLRTMQRLGVFAATVITAITAQNLEGVRAVQGTTPEVLSAQLDAVLEGFPVAAIKTGMLWSTETIERVSARLQRSCAALVIDPVMIATSGARLLDAGATRAYRRLFPRATLVTPNLDEAAVFLGRAVDTNALRDEAVRLAELLGCSVLLKGGHLEGPPVDVLAVRSERRSTEPRARGAEGRSRVTSTLGHVANVEDDAGASRASGQALNAAGGETGAGSHAVTSGPPMSRSRRHSPERETVERGGCSVFAWRHARIVGANTHGSGCMLSAAIAAHLARGLPLVESCASSLAFVHDALARGVGGVHRGLAHVEAATADAGHLERVEL